MSFDNPLDADRPLHAARLQLRPAPHAGRSRPRRHRIIGCAPVARRRIRGGARLVPRGRHDGAPSCGAVGASTALAAISQFFPLGTAMEAFAQAGAPEKKDLKVGFIPITCATPIIMAHPMGYYTKHGLNVEVVKTAGWAVIRDKTLNKEYDAAHMLSPMPLAITLGVGSNSVPYTMPADREHQRPGHHARHQAQGQARPEGLEGLQVRGAVRLLDAQLSVALLRGRARPRPRHRHPDPRHPAAGDGGQPARRQHRRLPRRPTPSTSARSTTASASSTCCRRRSWDGHPCCVFAASKEFVTQTPNTYAALLKAIIDATAFAAKPENRKQIAEAISPANYSTSPSRCWSRC